MTVNEPRGEPRVPLSPTTHTAETRGNIMALRTELLQFVKESLLRGEREVGPEDSLIDLGVIDSIGLMQLMTFLEERTGTRIPDRYVTPDNFQSIVAMERMLEDLKGN